MTQMRNLTHDFVRRTKANLETIEKLAEDNPDKHYEVTQLVNSCVGLLFIPTEDQIDRLLAKSIQEFLGGIRPPQILHGDLKYDNAAGLVRYLRNAFVHQNFDFEYANNRIFGVYMWNKDEGKLLNWVAYLRVDDLHALLIRLADNYLEAVDVHAANGARLRHLEATTGQNFRLTNPSGK